MEKLDNVIAGLAGCIACNCSNCEYFDPGCDTGCTERLMHDALEAIKNLSERLKSAKDGRLLLAERCRELEEKNGELRHELEYERSRVSDFSKKVIYARSERDEARRKILLLEGKLFELRSMPNDYGEYPPEFPREGM